MSTALRVSSVVLFALMLTAVSDEALAVKVLTPSINSCLAYTTAIDTDNENPNRAA